MSDSTGKRTETQSQLVKVLELFVKVGTGEARTRIGRRCQSRRQFAAHASERKRSAPVTYMDRGEQREQGTNQKQRQHTHTHTHTHTRQKTTTRNKEMHKDQRNTHTQSYQQAFATRILLITRCATRTQSSSKAVKLNPARSNMVSKMSAC